jgi:hypothetical protein
MAINPFPRITGLDIPQAYPAPRIDPSAFRPLSEIGESIAGYREQQFMSDLLRGATDASGKLDFDKAATAIALSGRDPMKVMNLLANEQARRELERHHRISEEAALIAARRPQQWFYPGGLVDQPAVITAPREEGKPPIRTPVPGTSITPPGPQSTLPGGGPTLASMEPDQFAPEEAPPYRVAGPPMPPPQQATPAQAAPTVTAPTEAPKANERYLAQFPGNVQGIVRDLGTLKRDPHKVQGTDRDKEQLYEITRNVYPGWSPEDYGKAQTKISQGEGEKLAKEGGQFKQVYGFADSFQDHYTISGLPGFLGLGKAGIKLGQSSPKMLSNVTGMPEGEAVKAVNFWNEYGRYKNVVRNAQFGASLTRSEQEAFDAADITENMDPRVIKNNLAAQQEILRGAMLRKAQGLMAEGVTPDKIEAYYGVPIKSLEKEVPRPEVKAPGPAPIKNDRQAAQAIEYTKRALREGLIDRKRAIEDLTRLIGPGAVTVLGD